MFNLARFFRPGADRKPERLPATDDSSICLLVITSDDPFYSSIQTAASPYGWTIARSGTVEQAMEALRNAPAPVVVYDWISGDGEWESAFNRLVAMSAKPCVVLASRVIDEYLLQDVVRRGGEDVVPRAAERVIQAVRFAAFRRRHERV